MPGASNSLISRGLRPRSLWNVVSHDGHDGLEVGCDYISVALFLHVMDHLSQDLVVTNATVVEVVPLHLGFAELGA
eukprot:1020023-Heterocapsa_arctica.AAC.1